MIDKQHLINRFLSYVVIDTTSDPENSAFPSTEKQWVLAKMLEKELIKIGMQEVELDENCYLMATLPSNISENVPTIGFISHIDTSPDFSGTNVNPQIIENYQGNDIIINEAENIILSPNYFEDLQEYIGQTIITTDGTTLLGADDKAGITEIVTAMEYLMQHPEIKHGKIRICFTPDEEVGKGAHLFDVEKFGADWAYTMDGSQIGELEYENFNAASAVVTIKGKMVHPGYAKGKMINSLLLATDFINALPTLEIPGKTEGYEGFFHLHKPLVQKKYYDTLLFCFYIVQNELKIQYHTKQKRTQLKVLLVVECEFFRDLILPDLLCLFYQIKTQMEKM